MNHYSQLFATIYDRQPPLQLSQIRASFDSSTDWAYSSTLCIFFHWMLNSAPELLQFVIKFYVSI